MGIHARLVEDGARQERLRRAVGVRDGDGICRVVGGRAEDDGKNPVVLGQSIIQTLDNDRRAAITSAVPIGFVVKGSTGAGLGQELASAETRENVRVCHAGEAADHGRVTVPCPERRASNLHSCRAGGTGRVDVEAWSTEAEVVIDAARAEGAHASRDEIGVHLLGRVDLAPVIRGLAIKGTDAIKPGRWCPVWDVTGHLQGLVRSRQGHSLHRICLQGLAG